ncbi:MAG: CRISPR system precrRNA processing endoribonuclease RAMP protein Cas6 [Desulfobacterales bacterium]|nr:CRISPR system precrRNA processing endoribonuclease RAMP protein Cas6 [Desulfobacterales bacterium]
MLFGKYDFSCVFQNDSILPSHKCSIFRGIFGYALKTVVCALKQQECSECILKKTCVFTLIFETGNENLKPFVIEPPLTKEISFPVNSSFDFSLILFGKANNYLPYAIYSFYEIGKIGIGQKRDNKRGKFIINHVKFQDKIIYSYNDQTLDFNENLPNLSVFLDKSYAYPNGEMKIKLYFKTPLRIKHENKFNVDNIPFHILIRTILRRISSLFNAFGYGEPILDYKGLVTRANDVKIIDSNIEWLDYKRYSSRQEEEMFFGGIIGDITYQGKLDEFMPLINLASKIHIGKQTTFGLGNIKAEIIL